MCCKPLFKTGLILLLITSSFNLGFAATKPDWIENGKISAYPGEIFYTGLGEGYTPKDAENQALEAISKQISSEVSAKDVSKISAVNSEINNFFEKNVTVKSDSTLAGARFVERFKTPDDKWHVFGVLKISEYAEALFGITSKCFASLTPQLNNFNSVKKEKSASTIFSAGVELIALATSCEGALTKFNALSNSGVKLFKKLKENELNLFSKSIEQTAEVFKELGKLTFASSHEGASAELVMHEFDSLLLKIGLKQIVKPEEADIILYGKFNKNLVSTDSQSLIFAKGSFEGSLTEKSSGKTFFKCKLVGEGGGSTSDTAINNVADEINSQLTKKFISDFYKKGE